MKRNLTILIFALSVLASKAMAQRVQNDSGAGAENRASAQAAEEARDAAARVWDTERDARETARKAKVIAASASAKASAPTPTAQSVNSKARADYRRELDFIEAEYEAAIAAAAKTRDAAIASARLARSEALTAIPTPAPLSMVTEFSYTVRFGDGTTLYVWAASEAGVRKFAMSQHLSPIVGITSTGETRQH